MASILRRTPDEILDLRCHTVVENLSQNDCTIDPVQETRDYLHSSAEAFDTLGIAHPDGETWQTERPLSAFNNYPSLENGINVEYSNQG